MPVSNLAPGRDSVGQLAGEFGIPRQAFQDVEADTFIVSIRPQLQRPAGGPLSISIGVYGAGRLGRAE